jgi:hypothetical protein
MMGGRDYSTASTRGGPRPETLIAEQLRRDLGVEIEPADLRMFIRDNWKLLDVCAHRIHRGGA